MIYIAFHLHPWRIHCISSTIYIAFHLLYTVHFIYIIYIAFHLHPWRICVEIVGRSHQQISSTYEIYDHIYVVLSYISRFVDETYGRRFVDEIYKSRS